MNSTVGDAYAEELVKLFRQQGSSLFEGQHSLCLTTPCLHYLQWKFSAIQEASTDPVSVKFAVLHQLQDSLAKTVSLKLVADKQLPLPPTATLNLEPFRALCALTLKKVSIQAVIGLQRLRSQLKVLVIQRCDVENIEDVIVRCGGDDSTSFAWNSLKELDLSSNKLTKLGDSLQYLPCLEHVNFSNNSIGSNEQCSVPPVRLPVQNGGQGSSEGGVASGSGVSMVDSLEGIICVENVTFLHLGFNKLTAIPRFAARAKYNLTILNLRNNELESIEGVHELDRLVELDLTDNILTKRVLLSPLKNLHHLAMLSLQGNPISFHPKHRMKTVAYLSNLIDKNAFRLEGKKLSSAEKKVVSNSLTHYHGPSTLTQSSEGYPISSHDTRPTTVTPIQNGLINNVLEDNVKMTDPNARFYQTNTSLPDSVNETRVVAKKSRKKKGSRKEKVIVSEDEEDIDEHAQSRSKEDLTVGSVPLIHEHHLDKIEQFRKQLEDDWIKTINSASSSTGTEEKVSSNSHSLSFSSSQPSARSLNKRATPSEKINILASPKRKPSLDGLETQVKSRGRKHRSKRQKGGHQSGEGVSKSCEGVGIVEEVRVVEEAEEVEGMFGPRTSSPDRGHTPSNIGGECFLVERYESDEEEDDGSLPEGRQGFSSSPFLFDPDKNKQVMVVLTERFLVEKSSQGELIDRWDLNCLQEATITKRPWKKKMTQDSKMSDVLSLRFSLDRRDRCRREYVLLEDGVDECLLGILNPIIEQNRATLPVENKLECLHCQRVFEKSQALDEPTGDQKPLPLGSHKNRSLSQLMCPFCHSQLLQLSLSSNKTFNPIVPTSSHSPKQRVNEAESSTGTVANSTHLPSVVNSSNQVISGFQVIGHHYSDPPCTDDVCADEDSVGSQLEMADKLTTSHADRDRANLDIWDGFVYDEPKANVVKETGNPSKQWESGSSGENEDISNSHTSRSKSSTNDNDGLSPWKLQKPMEKASSFDSSGELGNVVRPRTGAIVDPDSVVSALLASAEHHMDLHATVDRSGFTFSRPFPINPLTLSDLSHMSSVTDGRSLDPQSNLPSCVLDASTSVPLQSKFHTYMESGSSRGNVSMATAEIPPTGHNRSKSDCHPRVTLNATPPSARKKYSDPYIIKDGQLSRPPLSSLKEGETQVGDHFNRDAKTGSPSLSGSSLGRTSLCSLNDRDSPHNKHGDSPHNKHEVDFTYWGYSSGETKKSSKNKKSRDRGYNSADARSTMTSPRGYTSSEYTSRTAVSTTIHRVHSSGDISGSPRKSGKNHSNKNSKKSNSKGGSSPGSPRKHGNVRTSSDDVGIKPLSLVVCKDDDPTYIDSNLNLYLDMEIFNNEKKEHFKLVFRSPVVQYGHSKEMLSIVVVSNMCVYIFRITAPENSTPTKWLELMATHLLRRLVYIDIGVGYQFIRLEFKVENGCYNFLLRNEEKCTSLSTKLAFIVADVPQASFRTVGVCPFSIEALRHPNRVLREIIMVRYEKITGSRSHTPTSGLSSRHPEPTLDVCASDSDDLVLYRLAHKHLSGRTQGTVPITVVLTKSFVYIAQENFRHWPLSRIQALPDRDSLKPPFSGVQQRSITDIEQIVLDQDQPSQVKIRFFRENVSEDEESYWCLIFNSAICVDMLVSSIKTVWKVEFGGIDLPIIHK